MTRAPRIVTLVGLVWCLSPATASADWLLTPFIGFKFQGKTNVVDLEQGAGNTKLTLGGSAALLGDDLFGIEVDFGYSPRFFERTNSSGLIARSNVTTLTGNVIVAAPVSLTRDSLRPFAVGGVGLIHVGIDVLGDVLNVNSNLVGVNVGGGAIGALTNRTSVRFELRYFRTVTQDEEVVGFGPTRLSFWRAAVGIFLKY